MLKIFYIIIFTISYLPFKLLAQSTKGFAPEIAIGIAARNASIELTDYPIRSGRGFGFYYDQIKMSRNRNLSIDIGQFVFKKKLFVELSSYMRYGHFHYETNNTNSNELKRFKYDVFVNANYYLKWKKTHKSSLILGLGFGKMNMNTGFHYDRLTGEIDASGNYIKANTKSSFSFIAPRFLLGVDRNRFKAYVIANGTPDDDYRSNPTIWLEFKATYTIKPFEKK